jgi:salicylate hydroxylase
MAKKVLIAGAGIGGLTAALAMAKRGHRVEIYEQAAELREVGAGIQLSPNAMHVLNELGLAKTLMPLAFRPQAAVMRHWQTGIEYLSVPLAEVCVGKYGARYLHIHRADLHNALVQACTDKAIPIKLNSTVSAYQQDAVGVTLLLESTEKIAGDILLGAEGIHSKIQACMHGLSPAQFTGQIAWRGTIKADKLPPGLVKPNANLWVGPGKHMVTYYLRGGELVNFVAVEERSDWIKESWNEPGDIGQLQQAFCGWHPEVSEVLQAADECFLWALFDRKPLESWVDGRVALLGDACHPMLPFLAQGAAMAVEDAYVLGAMLDKHSDIPSALQAYQALRYARTSKIQAMARANAKLFHMSDHTERAKLQLIRIANKIMPSIAAKPLTSIYAYNALSVGS